jgi:hypothetical protein
MEQVMSRLATILARTIGLYKMRSVFVDRAAPLLPGIFHLNPYSNAIMTRAVTCFFLLGFGLLMVRTASAAPLGDLFAGGQLTVGDKVFAEWVLVDYVGPGDPNGIEVTGNNSDPLNPLLQYNALGNLTADPDDTVIFDFDFVARTVDGSARITDNMLSIDQVTDTGDLIIDLAESVFDATGLVSLADKLVSFETPGPPDPPDHVIFDAQAEILVQTSIVVDNLDLDFAGGLNQFSQSFSQRSSQAVVPEPTTFTLAIIGLLFVSHYGRRRRRNR